MSSVPSRRSSRTPRDGQPQKLEIYGILAPGWTRDQLMQLLEHPVSTERSLHHGR